VLAVAPGEVATADYLGGYGLTVILRHEEGTQESRYAHLSEVFVQPGESVDQGNVIGLVGSTGFSTGPHLHFEWRHQTTDGWVAVDAGAHLEYAMAQLIEALQVAQAIEQSDS
jgi:murein DD-endopeptidase MepM/ murein hydrolase activator NlpD